MEQSYGVTYLESLNSPVMKLGLENITKLMDRLKNPEGKLNIIHVAGTNGKGSVSQFIRSMLVEGGYKVGVFSSPHLMSLHESIRINNRDILDEELTAYALRLKEVVEKLYEEKVYPSHFEVLTALALLYFYEQKTDFVILEVGLGGALDATNVITSSLISVITKISKDHTDFLGDTLAAIAKQKAGIIKENSMTVAPIQEEEVGRVISRICAEKKNQLIWMNPKKISTIVVKEDCTTFQFEERQYQLQMVGAHQAYNCSIALKVIECLKEKGYLRLSEEQIKQGVYKAKWEGRFEKIRSFPKVFVDGAHNVDGIKALAATMNALDSSYKIGIVGILRDKDVEEMLKIICPRFDVLITAPPNSERSMKTEELAKRIGNYHSNVYTGATIKEAVELAMKLSESKDNASIIAFGSLYMIGEVRSLFQDK